MVQKFLKLRSTLLFKVVCPYRNLEVSVAIVTFEVDHPVYPFKRLNTYYPEVNVR